MGRRKKADATPEIGGNLKEIKQLVKSSAVEYVDLKSQRKDINAEMASIRERLRAQGITKKAFEKAVSDSEMDPGPRQEADAAYAICREALGIPIQGELDI